MRVHRASPRPHCDVLTDTVPPESCRAARGALPTVKIRERRSDVGNEIGRTFLIPYTVLDEGNYTSNCTPRTQETTECVDAYVYPFAS